MVLASASTIFRDMFQTVDENVEYEVIHMKGKESKLIEAMVELLYNGETTVKERDCQDFLNTLKEYKIVKVKSTEETNKIRCNFFNRGFCSAGSDCLFDHPEEDCEAHMVGNFCRDRKCRKRNRFPCKYRNSERGCTRGEECMFLHEKPRENIHNVSEDSYQKCDTCKLEHFNGNQVKIHEIKEHKFMLCLECDKNIKHKEVLLTKDFDMKDYLSVIFRNVFLTEIAMMVNY